VEVADRADVLEPLGLAEHDPGGVVAPVLEALEPLEKQRLRLTRADVSDDPAHSTLSFRRRRPRKPPGKSAKARLRTASPASDGLAELSSDKGGDLSTEPGGLLLGRSLGEHADHALRAGRPDEDAAVASELVVQPLHLLLDRRSQLP